MQERCSKPYCLNYKDYGARGISVCEEWNSPTIFIEWCLDNGWQSHLQIDRINNDGNYEPKNCRFVNQKQQMNNTRSNHWIEYDNKRKTLQQWGEFLNIKPNTILTRIRRGWPTGRALELE